MVSTVWSALYCWCDTGAGLHFGRQGLPGTSVVAVGAVLLLLLCLVLGRSLTLFFRLCLGLFGAVCCFVSAAPVHNGCLLPLLAALGLASVLPFCFVDLCWRAGSPSWSVPFGASRCCLCCYTYSRISL